jgi:glutathione S-transferase
MLTLYFKPTCSFSQRVLQMADNLNVSLELKDVSEDEAALAELLTIGGEQRTPFLVDSERDVSMYESSDIIDYLREHGKSTTPVATATRPRIFVGGSVCESCEG